MPWLNFSDPVLEHDKDFRNAVTEWLADMRIDPYFIWNALIDFAQTDDRGAVVDRSHEANRFARNWPLVVELNEGVQPSKLSWATNSAKVVRLSDVYATELPNRGKPSRYLTVLYNPANKFEPLLQDMRRGHVLRFQLGKPINSNRSDNPAVDWKPPSGVESLHFVGVIDDGLPFAHPDINPNGDDVYFVWDQTGFESTGTSGAARPKGTLPTGMSYGQEFVGLPERVVENGMPSARSSAIKHAIETARASHPARYDQKAYEILGYDVLKGAQRQHGVGVLHAASGRGARPPRIAGGSPLRQPSAAQFPTIAVQFPRYAATDTSGTWLGFHTLDGVRYIINRAENVAMRAGVGRNWTAVINVSFGGSAGPHDGTSILEGALDELCAAYAENVAIVLGAGNTYGRRMHAHRDASSAEPGRFKVNVPPDKTSPTYVEFWLPESLQSSLGQLHFEVVSPDGEQLDLYVANLAVWRASGVGGRAEDTTAAAIFSRRVAQGKHGTMMLLAIRPTAASRDRKRALAGGWTVTVRLNPGVKGAHDVHAWIERDDRLVGVRRSQQARFVDDGSGSVPYVSDSIKQPLALDRYTINSIANGKQTFVVGSLTARSRLAHAPGGLFAEVPRYSSSGPGVGSSRFGPEFSAVADTSFATNGLIFSGTFGGQTTRMSGTSIAAPRVARAFAELLASGTKIVSIRARAHLASRPPKTGLPPPPGVPRPGTPIGERVAAWWLP